MTTQVFHQLVDANDTHHNEDGNNSIWLKRKRHILVACYWLLALTFQAFIKISLQTTNTCFPFFHSSILSFYFSILTPGS
jgi:hypothetical protein